MPRRKRYRRRRQTLVTAVRLDLETPGFSYLKWGHIQRCKAGDWLIDRDGEIYTVDGDVFARTYIERSPGRFEKITPVWAERAEQAGSLRTHEGRTDYQAGDYLVFNEAAPGDDAQNAGTARSKTQSSDLSGSEAAPGPEDGWAMSAERFRSLYDRAE